MAPSIEVKEEKSIPLVLRIPRIHIVALCHDRISNKDAKPRFRQLSPRVAHPRTPKNGNARSFGLLAFRTPRLPRFTFCATAEIET